MSVCATAVCCNLPVLLLPPPPPQSFWTFHLVTSWLVIRCSRVALLACSPTLPRRIGVCAGAAKFQTPLPESTSDALLWALCRSAAGVAGLLAGRSCADGGIPGAGAQLTAHPRRAGAFRYLALSLVFLPSCQSLPPCAMRSSQGLTKVGLFTSPACAFHTVLYSVHNVHGAISVSHRRRRFCLQAMVVKLVQRGFVQVFDPKST